MPTDEPTVAGLGSCCNGDNTEQDDWKDEPTTSTCLRWRAQKQFAALLELAEDGTRRSYENYEILLIAEVFRLGRLLVALEVSKTAEESRAFDFGDFELVARTAAQRMLWFTVGDSELEALRWSFSQGLFTARSRALFSRRLDLVCSSRLRDLRSA